MTYLDWYNEQKGLAWTNQETIIAGEEWLYSLVSAGGGISLAGTRRGGKIGRSTDYGLTWTDIGTIISGEEAIYSLESLGSGIILAGTYANGKIGRSIDCGLTWTDIGTIIPGERAIFSLESLGSGIILAGTYPNGKIGRSTDYGLTWTDIGTIIPGERDIRSLISLNNGVVIAGTYSNAKIGRSTDYGLTWTDIGTIIPGEERIFSLESLGSGIILAGTFPHGKIGRSSDYGLTWTDIGTMIPGETAIFSLESLGSGIILAGTYPNAKLGRFSIAPEVMFDAATHLFNDLDTKLDTLQADLDNPDQFKANVSPLATGVALAAVQADLDNPDQFKATGFALPSEYDAVLAAIQADLDNPDQFKANVSALVIIQNLIEDIDTSAESMNRFTEIKGIGWTSETLKAIKDAIDSGINRDWSDSELADIRGALGILGDKTTPADGHLQEIKDKTDLIPGAPADQLLVESAITAAEENVRGAESDDLDTISDQIDAVALKTDLLTFDAGDNVHSVPKDLGVCGDRFDDIDNMLAHVDWGLPALEDLIEGIDTSTELESRFTEIKGIDWTNETLKAIKDAIDAGGGRDWSDAELTDIRGALGVEGPKTTPDNGQLQDIKDGTDLIGSIKTKTDRLQFADDDDVIATLQGERVNLTDPTEEKLDGILADTSEIGEVKSQSDKLQFTPDNDVKATLDGEQVVVDPIIPFTLELLKKIGTNRLELASGTTNNWILYDDDDTPLLTFSVRDKSGFAIELEDGAPARRSKGI